VFFEGGLTYELLHRYADAISAYDRALNLAPDLHAASIERALAHFRWQGRLDTLREVMSRIPPDVPLTEGGSIAAYRAVLLLLERNAKGLLLESQRADGDAYVGQVIFLPRALYAAWAHRLLGDEAAARAAFEAARVRLDAAMREIPDDWRIHAARGLALAGLGRRDDARGETRWLRASMVYREDAYDGAILAEDLARILAQAGDADPALDEIERLLAGPSWLSIHTLRLDPRWDPIRSHPRFRALLAKYSASEAR